MAKDRTNMRGPTQEPKEAPTPDRSHRKVQSRDELKERTLLAHHDMRPGTGRRNGSAKKK